MKLHTSLIIGLLLIVLIPTGIGMASGSLSLTTPTQSQVSVAFPTNTHASQLTDNPQVADGETTVDSGTTYWQGGRLHFNGSRVVDNLSTATQENRTFQIRRVNESGTITGLVGRFTIDRTGHHAIATSRLEGRVLILYQGTIVYADDGVGYTSTRPDGTTVTVNNSVWRVTRQRLTVDWYDETVYEGQHTSLDFRSNRDTYTVAISGRNITYHELEQIFPPHALALNHDARRDEGAILVNAKARESYVLNFSGIEPDTYVLTLNVTDTTGRETTTIKVTSPGTNRFQSVERADTVGDILQTTIHCNRCYLIFGRENQGVLDVVELRDRTGDNRISLSINTRYVGLDRGGGDVPEAITVYDAGADSATRYRNSRLLASDMNLAELRADLDLRANGRSAPIPPGRYDLYVAGSDDLIDLPPPSGGRLVVQDEQDRKTIRLTAPGIDQIETRTAPPSLPEVIDADEVRSLGVDRHQVVLGDLLVIRIKASGLFGYLSAEHNNRASGILANTDEGIRVRARYTGSQPAPNKLDLERTRVHLIPFEPTNELFLLVDTRTLLGTQRSIQPGDPFRLTFQFTGIRSDRPGYSVFGSDLNHQGYPYVGPGQEVSASTTIRFVQPTATVNGVENKTLRVPTEESVLVTGSANVSPGTQMAIRALGTGSKDWVADQVVTVQPDGTWAGTLDFSVAKPDEPFMVRVRRGGVTLTRVSGITERGRYVPSPTPTEPGGPTPSEPTPTEHQPPSPRSPTPTSPTATPPSSPTSPTPSVGTPGPGTPVGPSEPPGGNGETGEQPAFVPALPHVSDLIGFAVVVLVVMLGLGATRISAVR